MKVRKIALLLVGIVAISSRSADASILDRKYPLDKLDAFWSANFHDTPPQSEWFSELVSNPEKFSAVTTVHSSDAMVEEIAFDGIIIGEEVAIDTSYGSDSGQNKQLRAFPVIPIPTQVASKLYQRLPLLEIFLNRYQNFAPASTDTPKELEDLTKRYRSVALEIYLINSLRYFAESSFAKKCDRFRRVEEIYNSSLKNIQSSDLLINWQDLWPLYQSVQSRLGNDILKNVACSVSPAQTRSQIERKVKALTERMIAERIHTKVEETLTLLKQASHDFQSVVQKMNAIKIVSSEVMSFEETLKNVQANLEIVKKDLLKEQVLLNKLNDVDLSLLKNPSGNQELESAFEKSTRIIEMMVIASKELAFLSKISNNPLYQRKLAVCELIPARIANLDFNKDSASLKKYIMEPYELCLHDATTMVKELKHPSVTQKTWAQFSALVKEISSEFLRAPTSSTGGVQ
ncbi:MAG: hypothetical protein HQK50_08690 [Oligoflexia bacterium]|nr:hypothetical protein [Oligoflexia bacterium]MBF0365635.1 hypothetical protein [Oligoflexia bacterium]